MRAKMETVAFTKRELNRRWHGVSLTIQTVFGSLFCLATTILWHLDDIKHLPSPTVTSICTLVDLRPTKCI